MNCGAHNKDSKIELETEAGTEAEILDRGKKKRLLSGPSSDGNQAVRRECRLT